MLGDRQVFMNEHVPSKRVPTSNSTAKSNKLFLRSTHTDEAPSPNTPPDTSLDTPNSLNPKTFGNTPTGLARILSAAKSNIREPSHHGCFTVTTQKPVSVEIPSVCTAESPDMTSGIDTTRWVPFLEKPIVSSQCETRQDESQVSGVDEITNKSTPRDYPASLMEQNNPIQATALAHMKAPLLPKNALLELDRVERTPFDSRLVGPLYNVPQFDQHMNDEWRLLFILEHEWHEMDTPVGPNSLWERVKVALLSWMYPQDYYSKYPWAKFTELVGSEAREPEM
ncbi:uncharacterized protein CANTADRAFT_20830 [Suhomyces tanzawaensis NRRL Y-17324]|uniref:Uncharacterized protein n=1 Tax=Suhomyces tanzawaensis NRRL Y-17324 TaxID=984487 RepID=A0A1E4SP58_9ASCO|nr:uncharacterized protein CANTADRAFT_20830 [Suhomyces tanzawaensis NRRL Y-17324]ODV81311.1 hypothetical protein CANTADRAFT_20830 [Suhomyces tanzawaensis NRRL Y-17324]